MTVQFVDGHFVDSYYPTIENTFSKMIKWKNQDFATEIIDTAGQVREVFSSPRNLQELLPHLSSGLCETAGSARNAFALKTLPRDKLDM
jgi:GTPase SAR1 family protein